MKDRITSEDLERKIIHEHYHLFPGTQVTACLLILDNGYSLIGMSVPSAPGRFDEDAGRLLARKQAKEKMWALEGYALRERQMKHKR